MSHNEDITNSNNNVSISFIGHHHFITFIGHYFIISIGHHIVFRVIICFDDENNEIMVNKSNEVIKYLSKRSSYLIRSLTNGYNLIR